MKERRTFLLPPDGGLRPDDVKVTAGGDALRFRRAHEAAIERRITAGLRELPEETQAFLSDFHELHIRFAASRKISEHAPGVFSPILSRVPAGLHAFFTPRETGGETGLCTALKDLIDPKAKCAAAAESFSKPPILSERFASSSTYQFYHPLLESEAAIPRIRTRLCGTRGKGSSRATVEALCDLLDSAAEVSHVDLDFDAISHALVVTSFSPPVGLLADTRQEPHVASKPPEGSQLEVGVLQAETAKEPEELSMGGFLTVVGEAEHPSGTLFSFPARHHPDPSTARYSAGFQLPSGLHPKYEITLPIHDLKQPKDSCALHAYWTLPSTLFIDRYQLSDPLFLASQNLVALHSLTGEQDLEAPDWAVAGWGSAALLELAHPDAAKQSPSNKGNWTITIPTHLRYLPELTPSNATSAVQIPWAVVFWACEAEDGLKMATNPFDRVNLGYDGLFGPKTMFYHIPPVQGRGLTDNLTVPTLNSDQIGFVPMGTLMAVLAGFAWICWKLIPGTKTPLAGNDDGKKKQ